MRQSPWRGGHLGLARTRAGGALTQPDQVYEMLQALDLLDDVVVQLQLPQVLKPPEAVYAEDV